MTRILSLFVMFMLFGVLAFSQSRVVTGKVTDKDGNPIPFSSVKTGDQKSRGTSADANGLYSLKVKDGETLTISATGFDNESVQVSKQNFITTSLGTSTKKNQLDEIIVTTTFGQKKQKRELGTGTTVLSNKDVSLAGGQNIGASLNGKVAGLTVRQVNTGVTGDVRIVLRKGGSLTGNNEALLVVDGVIMPTDFLNSLNPADIASYNILKGPGGTALYGNEASNGAIVITTNKGSRVNKPVITLNSKVNFEEISYLPKLQNEYGSYGGEDFFDQYGNPGYVPYENQAFGPRYNGKIVPLGVPVRVFAADGSFTDIVNRVPYSAVPNNKKNFFNKSVTKQNDISFSNGDAKGSYYFSISDVRQDGIVPNDKSQRNVFKLNALRELSSRFSADFGFTYSRRSYNISGGDYYQDRPVYWNVINQPAHQNLTDYRDVVNNPFATPSGYANAYYGNPYWQTYGENSRNKDFKNEFIGNFALNYKISNYINAQYKVSYTGRFEDYQEFKKGVKFSSFAVGPATNDFVIDGITYPASGSNQGSSLYPSQPPTGYRQSYNKTRLQGDFLVTGQKDIFKNINAKLLVGFSVFEIATKDLQTGRDINGTINSYDDVGVFGPAYAIGNPLSYSTQSKQRSAGLFGDLTLGYRNFLFLHGSVRNDRDSRLEAQNRSFTYPAADMAFVFTDAFKGLTGNKNLLNYGKLRASYAKVGLINIAPYNTRNIYGSPAGFPFPTVISYNSGGTFNNLNIKPEFKTEKEAGLELVLFNNRLVLDGSVFKRITNNQTLTVNISAAAGRNFSRQNVGEVENNGVELDLKYSVVRNDNIEWKIGGNYSKSKAIVNEIAPGIDQINFGSGIYAVKGQAFPFIKVSDWKRDAEGRMIVDKITGLPSAANAIQNFGTTDPPVSLGLNTSLRFKSITFTALAEYRHGANIFNAIGADLDFTGISTNTTQFNRAAFVIPNSVYLDAAGKSVTNTNVVISQDQWKYWSNTNRLVNSNYVTSADFWKLREVTLSYDFPKSLFNKSNFIKAGSFTIFGRDLLMFRPKENIYTDPEFSNTTENGVGATDINQTPTTRKIGIGLNLIF